MADTGRQGRAPRGFGTLIGNGWLRESPARHPFWDQKPRSRSAMKKCMFIPVPPEFAGLPPPRVTPAAMAVPRHSAPRPEAPIEVRRRDPKRDVRAFPAYHAANALPANAGARHAHQAEAPRAWWEDPIALGSLLVLAPPIGLAAVWTSKRYSSDARWALTIVTSLMMCLVSAVVIACTFAASR